MYRPAHEQHEHDFFQPLSRYFVEYTRVAQIHGIRFITRRTVCERLFWGIITLCCVLVCFAQIFKLYYKLRSSPVFVVFNNEVTKIYEIPFPAVTICPEAKLDFTRISNLLEETLKSPKVDPLKKKMLEDLCAICQPDLDKCDLFEPNFFKESFYDVLLSTSVSIDNMLTQCRWQSMIVNCSEIFSQVMVNGDICLTFNSLDKSHIFTNLTIIHQAFLNSINKRNDWYKTSNYENLVYFDDYPRRSLTSGFGEGLHLRLNIENTSTFCKRSIQSFKVMVHAPIDIPRQRENFFFVSPYHTFYAGVEPMFTFTSKSLDAIHPRIRSCRLDHENNLKYFTIYSQKNCLIECLSNYTLLRCECVAYYMPRSADIPLCVPKNFDCIKNIEEELEYVDIKSTLNKSADTLSFCDCLPSCTSLDYDVDLVSVPILPETTETLTNTTALFTQLIIYFNVDDFTKLQRHESTSLLALLANMGGLFSIYTGASVITVIEFLYFWSGRLICNKKLYNQWFGPKPLTFSNVVPNES